MGNTHSKHIHVATMVSAHVVMPNLHCWLHATKVMGVKVVTYSCRQRWQTPKL